jgi:DNA modification methylase
MEQTIDIQELVQDQHNFNKGTAEGEKLMQKSLTELGAGRSILIDKDGNIIAGNKTQKAAIAAGIQKVRVIESDGSELIAVKRTDLSIDSKKGRELALADNVTTQVNLAWDAVELDTIAAQEGIDLDGWGVPKDVLKEPVEEVEVEEDDFDEEKDAVETICQEGDVWQLGEHRLMCGDSTKAEDVARLMNGELADLWLTDPPYNVDYSQARKDVEEALGGGSTHKDIANDKLSDKDFSLFLEDSFEASVPHLKVGGAFYVWTTQGHPLVQVSDALDSVGLRFRQQLIWVKQNFVLGRMDYKGQHEPCFYGWKEGASHYFVNLYNEPTIIIPDADEINIDKMTKSELRDLLHKIYENPQPTTVIRENRPTKSEEHPTMKPVRLFARLVRNSSRKGEIVLDTFGGSGTTIVACEQLHRKARLMELDPHYCDVIIARWEKLTGQKAIKL